MGVLINLQAGGSGASAPGIVSGILQNLASDAGGSRVLPQPGCTTGTGNLRLNKTGVHTGLAVGDEIILTYDKCVVSGAQLNGTAKVTLRSAVSASPTNDINASYDAVFTNLAFTYQGLTTRYSGAAGMQSVSTNSFNSLTNSFTVPAGQSLTLTMTNASGTMTLAYQGGTTFVGTDTLSPSMGSRKLDGTVRLEFQNAVTTYSIKSTTPLSGTISTAGKFTPNAGTVECRDMERNLATSTAISGLMAQVSGDTDGNGTLDLQRSTVVADLT